MTAEDAQALAGWLFGLLLFGLFAVIYSLQAIGCPCQRHIMAALGMVGIEVFFAVVAPRLIWGSGPKQ